jgi:hypothetical protein
MREEPLDPFVQWIVTEARRPVALDPAARERLMEALRAEPAPRRPAPLAWLTEPRQFALRPIASMALAAGLVGIGVIAGLLTNRDGRQSIEQALPVAEGHPQLPDSVAPRAIKFVLVAPDAGRVSLVGDFNQWDAAATPLVRDEKNGTWSAFVTLRPGMHTYSFVLDGRHFVADPTAPMAPDDGYGHKSSVVFVKGPQA